MDLGLSYSRTVTEVSSIKHEDVNFEDYKNGDETDFNKLRENHQEKNNHQSELKIVKGKMDLEFQEKINHLKQQHNMEKNDLSSKLQVFQLKWKNEIRELKQSHENKVESIEQKYEKKILSLQNEIGDLKLKNLHEYQEKIFLKERHDIEKNNLSTKLQEDFQLKWKNEIRELKQSHEKEVKSIKQKFEKIIFSLPNEIRALKKQFVPDEPNYYSSNLKNGHEYSSDVSFGQHLESPLNYNASNRNHYSSLQSLRISEIDFSDTQKDLIFEMTAEFISPGNNISRADFDQQFLSDLNYNAQNRCHQNETYDIDSILKFSTKHDDKNASNGSLDVSDLDEMWKAVVLESVKEEMLKLSESYETEIGSLQLRLMLNEQEKDHELAYSLQESEQLIVDLRHEKTILERNLKALELQLSSEKKAKEKALTDLQDTQISIQLTEKYFHDIAEIRNVVLCIREVYEIVVRNLEEEVLKVTAENDELRRKLNENIELKNMSKIMNLLQKCQDLQAEERETYNELSAELKASQKLLKSEYKDRLTSTLQESEKLIANYKREISVLVRKVEALELELADEKEEARLNLRHKKAIDRQLENCICNLKVKRLEVIQIRKENDELKRKLERFNQTPPVSDSQSDTNFQNQHVNNQNSPAHTQSSSGVHSLSSNSSASQLVEYIYVKIFKGIMMRKLGFSGSWLAFF